jgi:hypothetical protein
MSRPDDIPQGIWDAAEAAGEAMHGRHERGWVAWPLIPAHGTASHQEIVARAILAERLASATRLEAIAEELDSQPAWALYREAAQAVRNGTMPDDPLGIKASEQLVPHPVTGAPTEPHCWECGAHGGDDWHKPGCLHDNGQQLRYAPAEPA